MSLSSLQPNLSCLVPAPCYSSSFSLTRKERSLHAAAILHEICSAPVLRRIPLGTEVRILIPRLNVMFLADWNPDICEAHLRHGHEGEQSAAVVGDVAGDLIDRVIDSEDREDGVGDGEGRLLLRVDGGDEEINSREVGGFCWIGGRLKLFLESFKIVGAVDRAELGDLIEYPRKGKPEAHRQWT